MGVWRVSTCVGNTTIVALAAQASGGFVATDGTNIAAIHTHGLGKDKDYWFYKDVDPSFQWIHMPLGEGEYLTEICRQHGYIVYLDAFGLMVRYSYCIRDNKPNAVIVHHEPRPERHVWTLPAKARKC